MKTELKHKDVVETDPRGFGAAEPQTRAKGELLNSEMKNTALSGTLCSETWRTSMSSGPVLISVKSEPSLCRLTVQDFFCAEPAKLCSRRVLNERHGECGESDGERDGFPGVWNISRSDSFRYSYSLELRAVKEAVEDVEEDLEERQ